METKTKTVFSGFIWRLAERFGAQGVTFIVSIILARILDPEIYGTIAIVTVFTTIMQVFVDSGMGNALIQKKQVDDLDYSSVFYCNLVLCILLYAVMFFVAPLIANFYEIPVLTPIIRVLSLTLVFSGVRNVQQAYISRHMQFRKFFFATLGSSIASAVVGIFMAVKGYGVWALVGQQLISAITSTIVLWMVVRWRPKLMFSFSRLKVLFSFGWKLLVSALIDNVYNKSRQLIVGKMYSTTDLAFYEKGEMFPSLLVTNINTSIDSVLLPVMSKAQDNATQVKAMTRRAIKIGTFVLAPLMIGLAACAETFVRGILTDKWLGCVLFMQILCFSYMLYPIHTANLNAIKAMGRSDMFLGLEIVKKVIGVASILITMFISVEAMVYSVLVTSLISTIINAYPNKKLLNYSWAEQMKDILPYIGIGLVMAVPVYFMKYIPIHPVLILCLQIVVGAGLYIGISALLKLEVFNYFMDIIKGLLRRGKKGEKKMKKILLLGGARYLVPVIKTAKELGYYTITCDYLPDNVAHKYSDEYHNVSIIDKEAVLKLAEELKVDGVMAFACDPAVTTAAYVSEKLGLHFQGSFKSTSILQDKGLFRQFLIDNGFNCPHAKSYEKEEDVYKDLDYFNWPVIVKPVDSAGSKGVNRVDKKEDLAEAIKEAVKCSIGGAFIVEDFLTFKGYHSSADCFTVDGELKFCTFSDQLFDKEAENPYTPALIIFPSTMSQKNQEYLEKEIQRLMTLLDMKTGIYNIECCVGVDDKPYIMEVSPRGGGCKIAEIQHASSGVDLIKNEILNAVGEKVEEIHNPIFDGVWCEMVIHGSKEKSGVYKSLKIDPEIMDKYVKEIDMSTKVGDYVEPFTGANKSLGDMFLRFSSREELDQVVSRSNEWLEIELDEDAGDK